MVGATERAFTELALKGPVPGVLALMAGQLVAARKTPLTPLPTAHIGLLAGMGARMRLEVGGFGVGLAARAKRTRVNNRFASRHQQAAPTALFQRRGEFTSGGGGYRL